MNKISLETKSVLDNKFLAAFEREVVKVENRNIKILAKYYKKNYDQGISNFLQYNTTNYESLFKNGDLNIEYEKMYISIGNDIAKWYFQIFKKYQTKNDIGPYESEWERSFANYGSQVAATNVTLVNGTAKKTLVKLTQQLMKDPEFMQLGNQAKARVLRKKFNHYSNYQAQRLVRTESTRAANFAIEKSSQTLFSENELSKKWLAVMDGKERPWHRSANGQTVRMNENFVVGGEFMYRPGEGSARNVINCRCRILPIPDEGAVAITELDEIGVGLGRNRIEDFSLANLGTTVAEVIETIAARNVVDKISQKELMRPDNWDDIVKGAKINDDYLELLTEKLTLVQTRGGSFQRGTSIHINTQRYKNNINTILSHEIGHAVHTQRRWITQYGVDPKIEALFRKHQEMFGVGLRGNKRIEFQKKFKDRFGSGKFRDTETFNKYNKLKQKTRKKFPNMSDSEFNEKYLGIADYFGAVTKNQIGFGHTNSYYRTSKWQMFEMFAHIMENKYAKNEVFKFLYPKIHKQGIDMLDDLIIQFEKTKP